MLSSIYILVFKLGAFQEIFPPHMHFLSVTITCLFCGIFSSPKFRHVLSLFSSKSTSAGFGFLKIFCCGSRPRLSSRVFLWIVIPRPWRHQASPPTPWYMFIRTGPRTCAFLSAVPSNPPAHTARTLLRVFRCFEGKSKFRFTDVGNAPHDSHCMSYGFCWCSPTARNIASSRCLVQTLAVVPTTFT